MGSWISPPSNILEQGHATGSGVELRSVGKSRVYRNGNSIYSVVGVEQGRTEGLVGLGLESKG